MRSYNSMESVHGHSTAHDDEDENKIVIDYNALCDDIYVCDWVSHAR